MNLKSTQLRKSPLVGDRDRSHAFSRTRAVLRARPAPTLVVIATLLVFVSVGRIQDLLEIQAVPLAKALVLVGGVALVIRRDLRRRISAFGTRQGKSFLLFAFAMIASVPLSLVGSDSLTILIEVLPTMLAVVVLTVASVSSPQQIKYLFRAFSFSAIMLGCALLAGRGIIVIDAQVSRASVSSMYDPNDLALVASVSLAFSVSLLDESKWYWRLMGLAGMIIAPLIVVQTGSRGGLIALSFVILMVLLSKKSRISPWLRVSTIALLVFASVNLPSSFTARTATLFSLEEDYNMTGETGRLAIWRRGLGYVVSRPFTGVGLGQFPTAEGLWAEQRGIEQGFKWSTAHSIYIQVSAELGLIGLAGFLGMLVPNAFRIFRPLKRISDGQNEVDRLGWTLSIATVAFMLGGAFLGVAYGPVTFFLCATGISLSRFANYATDGACVMTNIRPA